eukprot:scaffold4026_cov117-Cylindrotheca_fusiformis.AAC.8
MVDWSRELQRCIAFVKEWNSHYWLTSQLHKFYCLLVKRVGLGDIIFPVVAMMKSKSIAIDSSMGLPEATKTTASYTSDPPIKFFLLAIFLLPSFCTCSIQNRLKSSRWFSVRGGAAQSRHKYRVVQVQIVHRHGDRTPITSLKDEEFWRSALVSPLMLERISQGTELIRCPETTNIHSAKGRGPFGKLTQLGLLQMVNVGTRLREELWSDNEDVFEEDEKGNLYMGSLWSPSRPLTTKDLRIVSTDFPRTIQSVQGVIVGLFPDGLDDTVKIDCRHTRWMIPDPQPRRTSEQEGLEIELASRPHIVQRESEMYPLAVRCTNALRDLLGEGAFDSSFGVDGQTTDDKKVLTWAQLSEITCCLKVRDRLPEGISPEDQDALSSYLAWRWFESLRHPRLVYLAMHKFCHAILHSMRHLEEEPPLTIYSAHDSTLVGLMCAFRLERPTVWPEYASYMKIELLEKSDSDGNDLEESEHVVRFYLNGELLRSRWHGNLLEEVTLNQLSQFLSIEGAMKSP